MAPGQDMMSPSFPTPQEVLPGSNLSFRSVTTIQATNPINCSRTRLVQALDGRKEATKFVVSILQRSMSRRLGRKCRLRGKTRVEDFRAATVGGETELRGSDRGAQFTTGENSEFSIKDVG